MAGSVFRPLTNIPYCCLPQESGPCLSTSVGDRPLRSPTHHGLGGPSPRRLPNGTHARPRPPLGFIQRRMPSHGTMAYYPAFPPAIRLSGVGCIRVAHPCATLKAPEGAYPVRLACIRPAASVHPEPGSNSSLYYCCTQIFLLNLGFRLDVHPGGSPRVVPSRATPRGVRASFLCWPQTFKELSASVSPSLRPLFRSESGCKSTTFFPFRKHFFQLFFYFSASC